jgi:hypothetical protein
MDGREDMTKLIGAFRDCADAPKNIAALSTQQGIVHDFIFFALYTDADKSLARPTSRCILFDGKNISFDASLVIYINSTNIPPVMIINRIYENQNLLSL